IADSGVVCRPSANSCDVTEYCDGVAKNCPANAFLDAGTACDDGNECSYGEACTSLGFCAGFAVDAGTLCDAGNPCIRSAVCVLGSCSGDTFVDCGPSTPVCHRGGICNVTLKIGRASCRERVES